jgi:hypothetical protein
MKQSRIEFEELPDDPAIKAEKDTIWWLVNRIRTQSEALEVFRLASGCLHAAYGAKADLPRSLKLSTALRVLGDALRDWDSDSTSDADRLNAWDTVEAQLARGARDIIRADRAACFHQGKLLFSALRQAYAIQKQSNQIIADWGARKPGLAGTSIVRNTK